MAVKTLKENATDIERNDLHSELQVSCFTLMLPFFIHSQFSCSFVSNNGFITFEKSKVNCNTFRGSRNSVLRVVILSSGSFHAGVE